VHDPEVLFPFLSALTFDGLVEIAAKRVDQLSDLRERKCHRAFLSSPDRGSTVERVAKLFARDARDVEFASALRGGRRRRRFRSSASGARAGVPRPRGGARSALGVVGQ
jgi:hypothetical protein